MKEKRALNNEYIPCRWNNGIRLIAPNDKHYFSSAGFHLVENNLASLLNMPFNVYFVNQNSLIQEINDSTCHTCGFLSSADAKGRTSEIVATKETALFEFRHEQRVIKENKMIILQENYQRLDGPDVIFMAFKFPWYNADNKIIGVFGCSLPLSASDFARSLTLLHEAGLLNIAEIDKLNHTKSSLIIDGIVFTRREMNCITLLCRGLTAKQMARILSLSHRTVENYIANIKCKLNVSTKAELVERIRGSFLQEDSIS